MKFKKWLNESLNNKISLTKNTKLYHATPYLKEIENSGFKTKRITGISTFGSAGAIDEDTISLTPDYQNALKYAKAIKLVVEIAHGSKDLTDLPEIIKEYKPFNLDDYYKDNFNEVWTIFHDNGRKNSKNLTEILFNWLKGNNWESDEQLTQKENQEITMMMTLGLGSATQGRFPWMIIPGGRLNAINLFKKTDPSNVGIVVAFIKDQELETQYIHGEKEVRIPPENLQIYGFENV
jgi:hypothetical protein